MSIPKVALSCLFEINISFNLELVFSKSFDMINHKPTGLGVFLLDGWEVCLCIIFSFLYGVWNQLGEACEILELK